MTWVTQNVTKGLIFLCLIIIIILIFLFSINIIYNFEKDISLYKLLGFKDSYIISVTLIFIIIYYFLVYILALIIYIIIGKLLSINNVTIIKDIKFMNLLNCTYLIYICGFIIIVTLLSFIRIIYKIKKNNPINLVNS